MSSKVLTGSLVLLPSTVSFKKDFGAFLSACSCNKQNIMALIKSINLATLLSYTSSGALTGTARALVGLSKDLQCGYKMSFLFSGAFTSKETIHDLLLYILYFKGRSALSKND